MKEELFLLNLIQAISNNRDFDWTRNPMTQAAADQLIRVGLGHKLGKMAPLSAVLKSRAAVEANDTFYGSVPHLEIPSVEDVSVLPASGANIVMDLPIDTLTIPTPAGTSGQWLAETAEASEGSLSLGTITLTPMRLEDNIKVSNRLLQVGGMVVQNWIVALLTGGLWGKLESTIFGKAAATATQPKGAFYDLSKPTVTVNTDHLLSLEEEIADVKTFPGLFAYITNQRGSTILKRTPGTVGLATRPLFDQGKVSEHPLFVTNAVATGVGSDSEGEGLLFARMSDLFVGVHGAYMLHVDPFTYGKEAITEITLSAYFSVTGMRATSADPYAEIFAPASIRY